MFRTVRSRLLVTYLAVILLAMSLTNLATARTLEQHYLREKEIVLLTQANMVANLSAEHITRADADLGSLSREWSEPIGARILILDTSGTVLADSFADPQLIHLRLGHPEVASALRGRSAVSRQVLAEGARVMYVVVPAVVNQKVVGAVFLSASLAQIYAELARIRWRLWLVTFAAVSVVGVFSLALASFLVAPVKRLTRAVERMSAGDLRQRVQATGPNELRVLGEAFNNMAARLEGLDTARRTFVADASHELRTPLAAMKALVQAIVDEPAQDPAIQREFLKDIEGEIDRLTRLANDLLRLTELESGQVALTRRPTCLNELASTVAENMRPLAAARGVHLEHLAGRPVSAPVDAERLQQVMVNLVDNAIRFTPAGGSVRLGVADAGECAELIVSDSGPGIPEEDIPRIFDRFYKADRARVRNGGTGLGLSIADHIVRLHGGAIRVWSREGFGTTFTVALPKR